MNKQIPPSLLLKKFSAKRYKVIFLGILAITVAHFAVQISFIQSETSRSADLTAQIEDLKPAESTLEIKQSDERIVKIKPEEYEVRKVKVITIPENVQPVTTTPRRQMETAPAAPPPPPSSLRTQTKRKDIRETRAARLRRAEKILTGI